MTRISLPPFCVSSPPLHSTPLKALVSSILYIHPHLGEEGRDEGDFLHVRICALTPITLSCLGLCFFSICCTFSPLLFLKLSISTCMYLCVSSSIVHTVKSDRLDKCGSVVTQIPEAQERAEINHFSPSLSSAISLPLCLCSPPFLPSIFPLLCSQHPPRHHYLLNVIQHFLPIPICCF